MAGYDAHYASTRKDKPTLPVPCLHSSHQRRQIAEPSLGKTSQRGGKGGKQHAPLRPPNPRLCFFKPAPCARLLPLHPLLRLIHPPLATLGHESRLCVTAHNIPCHKCFPKASTLVTLSAAKEPPHYPLMECARLTFCKRVNNFWLAGQTRRPGNVCAVRLHVCPHLLIYMFEYIYVFFFPPLSFSYQTGEKGSCHSSTT